jgi:hypothetical protein
MPRLLDLVREATRRWRYSIRTKDASPGMGRVQERGRHSFLILRILTTTARPGPVATGPAGRIDRPAEPGKTSGGSDLSDLAGARYSDLEGRAGPSRPVQDELQLGLR